MIQLFCLTYAGGTADFYNQLDPYFSSDYELIKLEYSGHGVRRNEKFYHDFQELALDMYEEIKKKFSVDKAYALLGYSMGSISVVEILKYIIDKRELPMPKHIFLAAHEPNTMIEINNYSGIELNEYVKERTVQFGGIPEKLIDNKSFWRVYLPVFRADYTIIGKYKFESLSLKTEMPVTIFYSESDTSYEDMKKWKKYFIGSCEFVEFEGNHFFIRECCKEITDVIKEKMRGSL